MKSKVSCVTSVVARMSLRSPPAKNVDLALANTTPVSPSSASSRSQIARIPGSNRAFIVLAP
jgi:hypothetical protein